MRESRRIFHTQGTIDDLENCKLAVNGFDGKIAGISLKSDPSVIVWDKIRVYAQNEHLFALIDFLTGETDKVIKYESVAAVHYDWLS